MKGTVLPALLLGSTLLCGCTTAGNPGLGLEQNSQAAAAFDLALPETVAVLPSFADGSAAVPIEAPAAFAGPTPSAGQSMAAADAIAAAKPVRGGTVDELIVHYATVYEVPVELVRRVVRRESNFRPGAYNNGHWGLMQIKHATAQGMGYDGTASGLLDAETNLRYAVKYLRGAYLVANGNHDLAVQYYARGYYYDARRKGLLGETGLGVDRRRGRI